jgi:hypothetical protein
MGTKGLPFRRKNSGPLISPEKLLELRREGMRWSELEERFLRDEKTLKKILANHLKAIGGDEQC